MDIIASLTSELNVGRGQVEAAVKLIDEGNTIPFIARYRKEATGSLNDEVLRTLDPLTSPGTPSPGNAPVGSSCNLISTFLASPLGRGGIAQQ